MSKKKWVDYSVNQSLKLHYRYFNPIFLNTSALTAEKPALYVGNHTLYGLLDSPLLWDYLQKQHGIYLRALGDRIHFQLPIWRDLLKSQGAIEGSPENCHALMEKGESILVFPGGAREVFKRKNEQHQLVWKQRTGFARMAIEHGYDIVPFAALGGDYCFDIQLDADDMQNNKAIQWMIKKLKLEQSLRGGELLPVLSTGVAKLPIPRPERLYYSFGERISTQHIAVGKPGEWQVRDQVAQSIETQLAELEQYRQQDRKDNWGWWRKKLSSSS